MRRHRTRTCQTRLAAFAVMAAIITALFSAPGAGSRDVYASEGLQTVHAEQTDVPEPGETYLILDRDQTRALSSDAGNQWGSGNAGIAVSADAETGQILSETDLSKCLWTYTQERQLLNQDAVYLNADVAMLKPAGESSTTWTYTDGRLVNQDDYAVYWRDTNFTLSGSYAGSVYAVYLYHVTEDVSGGTHTHQYTALVTEPTCTEPGYTTYVCSCGDTYTADETPALGHDWTDWTYDTASASYQHYRSCKRVLPSGYRCDAFETADCEHVLKKTVPPTCGERGYSLYRCDGCGHEIHTDYVAATGVHQYAAVSRGDGSGCHNLTCGICGQSIMETCTWDDGVVTRPATEEENGIITYTCTACGDTRTDVLLYGGGFSQDEQGNYLIGDEAQLRLLAELVNDGNQRYAQASYRLTDDITLTGEWTPIGTGSYTSGHQFSGTFDGDRHTISGLQISGVQDGWCYGLFGVVSDAVIKNLAVEGTIRNVSADTAGSKCHIGGIVGASYGSLELSDVAGHVRIINSFSYAPGSLYTGTAESHVGGLVGYAYSMDTDMALSMEHCYADADVTNENTNSNYAGYSRAYVGGLIGGAYHYYSQILVRDSFVNMDKITVSNTILAKDSNGAVYVYGDVMLGYNFGSISAAGERLYYNTGLAGSVANSSTLYTVGNRYLQATERPVTAALAGTDRYQTAADGKVIFLWEKGGTVHVPAKISIANAGVDGLEDAVYTGTPVMPELSVSVGGTILTAEEDYTVSIRDNTKVGLATVTITGAGTYSGTIEKTFRILFTDVTDPEEQFYFDYVYRAADAGIVAGWSDGTFRPLNQCSRAAVVTFLWRLADRPEPAGIADFTDMPADTEANRDFRKAISWAAEQGITSGWDDGTFRPWNTCNRAAVMTFLWRYAERPEPTGIADFTDMPADTEANRDFRKAISWAAEQEITTGWDDNTFRPWNTCNRLAVVSFLCRNMQ